MEAQRRETGGVPGTVVTATERRWVQPTTEAIAEDVLVGSRVVGAAAETVQRAGGLVRPRDLPEASALGRVGLDVGRQGARDDQLAAEELDIAPAQRDELALTQAGIGGDADQFGVLGVLLGSGCQLLIPDALRSQIAMGS